MDASPADLRTEGSDGAPARSAAIAQAVLVTFLWSTSWVLIKLGLEELELRPLSFAGVRYTLGAVVLLPLAWGAWRRTLDPADDDAQGNRGSLFARVALLGLLLYAITQGAQFSALALLPAVAVSLVLTATPVVVLLFAARRRDEPASRLQGLGVAGLVLGAALYFGPVALGADAVAGLLIAATALVANAASALLGRSLARDEVARLGGVLPLTAISMAVGGAVLLAAGVAVEGVPQLEARGWALVAWLAVVNTAFAFALWNRTLRTLTAVESSVLNNTMLVQIAALAWIFLGEALDARQLAGLLLAAGGVLVVQLAGGQRGAGPQPPPESGPPSARSSRRLRSRPQR